MSLTIDEAKVRESLEATAKPAYIVKALHLTSVEMPPAPTPSSSIGGTMMFGALRSDPSTRDFGSLRRKIEESGVALKSAEELGKEIDGMRGRGK